MRHIIVILMLTVSFLSGSSFSSLTHVSPISQNAAPDLAITNVYIKKNIYDGDIIGKNREIKIKIKNIGNKTAPKSILRISCEAKKGCAKILMGQVNIPSLRPNQSRTIYWPLKYSEKYRWKAGRYAFIAKIEILQNIGFAAAQVSALEKNLNNNKKQFYVDVLKKEKPDLTISEIKLSKRICANEDIRKSGKLLVTIKNIGKVDAKATTLKISCSSSASSMTLTHVSTGCPSFLSGIAKIPAIKAGKKYVLKWPYNKHKKWTKGRYNLQFFIDDRDKIDEENEKNNKKRFILNVKECKQISLPKEIKPLKVPVLKEKLEFSSIKPNYWYPGRTYHVYVNGKGFDKKLKLKFDKNVKIVSQNLINSNKIKLTIKTDKNAPAKKVKLYYAQTTAKIQKFQYTGLYGWIKKVKHVKKVAPPKIKLPEFSVKIPFIKGKIILERPKFGLVTLSNKIHNYGIPKLNDKTVFTFREQNPGLADWFELIITDKSGNILIKRNLGKNRYYRVDPDFVYEILSLMKSKGLQLAKDFKPAKPSNKDLSKLFNTKKGDKLFKKSDLKAKVSYPYRPTFTTMRKRYKDIFKQNISLFWSVIGKKNYPKDGIIKFGKDKNKKVIKFETVVVEESEKWPLAINDFITGLGCRAVSKGSINLQNLDLGVGKEPGEVSTVNYVGDRFELSGIFDIKDSPWGYTKPGKIITLGGLVNIKPAPRNIFISWGDGTVEPLKLLPGNSDTKFKIDNMLHQYASTGKKKIKIFMLPESDIQNIDVSNVVFAYDLFEGSKTASLDPVLSTVSFDNPYFQTLSLNGDLPKPNTDLLNVAKHAYIIYCNEIAIEPRKDLVATGPLHLDDIVIYDYNGGKVEAKTKKREINFPGKNIGKKQTLPTNVKTEKHIKPVKTRVSKISEGGKNLDKFAKSFDKKYSGLIKAISGVELSECDILQANAKLRYYGKGGVLFKWTLIGQDGDELVLNSEYYDVGPSKYRKNLTKDNYKVPTADSYSYYPVNSKILDLEEFIKNSKYSLVVDATVDAGTALALSQEEIVSYMINMANSMHLMTKFASNKITSNMYLAKKGGIYDPYLSKIKSSGVKIGILSPSKIATKGLPTVASINKFLDKSSIGKKIYKVKIPKRKPYYVKSRPFDFIVRANSSGKPCKIKLVTKSKDEFWVRNISDSVTINNGIYNGTGNIVIKINSSEPKEIVVPVIIDNWKVGGSDGITVQKGTLDTKLNNSFVADKVKFDVKRVYCKAFQTDLELSADLELQEYLIREAGSSEFLSWKNITSRLDSNGNWHFEDSKNRDLTIGWSGFRIKTSKINLDFDKNWGMGVSNECSVSGNSSKDWTGVHFTNAALIPNTFDLVQTGYTKNINDWGVSSNGLCGKATLGKFSTKIKKGSVSFDSVIAEAKNGNFIATYKNMDVYVPWLDIHLKGDAKLVDAANGKDPAIDFKGLNASPVEKDYGTIAFKAQDLTFGNYQDIGWAVWSNTYFTLSTKKKKVINDASVNGLIYGMDAKAYLAKEDTQTVALSGKANFDGTEVDLISMEVTPSKEGNKLIDFVVNTNFNVSEVLTSVPVTVRYALKAENENISSAGPNVDPFVVPVAFPMANPNMESRITCNYEEGSEGEQEESPTKYDQFNGEVEFELFEGQTIKAEFRLGYKSGHDYWMIRASVPFEEGITLMDPGLMLYEIRGGLGHNFPLDSFKKVGSIMDIYPSIDNSYLFFAGVDVGNENKFLYYLKGDLVIKLSLQARIDAHAWLLNQERKGDGDFQAYLQYANGSLDGALWGKLEFLKGVIKAEIPKDAAVLHVTQNDFYFYFGRKDGPRVKMKVLISESDAYLELEKNRYAVGGRNFYGLKGEYGRLYGELEAGYEIRFPPHISGYAEGTLAAQICCCKVCIGPSLSARVEASAMPVQAKCRACFDLGWPIGDICGTFKL